jgi:hypothetical protein
MLGLAALHPAAVLVLSKTFISTSYPMEELQLLLERRLMQNSNSVLLPVFYDVEWQEVHDKVLKYKKAAAAATTPAEQELLDTFWKDIEEMAHITGVRKDQVGRYPEFPAAANCLGCHARLLFNVMLRHLLLRMLPQCCRCCCCCCCICCRRCCVCSAAAAFVRLPLPYVVGSC